MSWYCPHLSLDYATLSRRTRLNFVVLGTPYNGVIFELDDRGLEQKITVFERNGKRFKLSETHKIEYDAIDEQGNWTKRTFYKNYDFDGVENFQPYSA